MNNQVVHQFNFTLKLNASRTPRLTDVAAQINFNIKLTIAREGQRQTAHEGVRRAFNLYVKLEYALTSVGTLLCHSNQFESKIEMRGYLSQRCRRGVIMGVMPTAYSCASGRQY